jgi:hypothetical protein
MSAAKAKKEPRKPCPSPRRRHRARPTPRWLLRTSDLDEMARRRCLMVLSVLSGEAPVTDVVEQHKISRMTYYKLESRALAGMLSALLPGAESNPASSSAARIQQLEEKVARLEKDKRRTERLLFMTRRVLKPGALTMGTGPKTKRRASLSSTSAGPKPSHVSHPKPMTHTVSASPSVPTETGEAEP